MAVLKERDSITSELILYEQRQIPPDVRHDRRNDHSNLSAYEDLIPLHLICLLTLTPPLCQTGNFRSTYAGLVASFQSPKQEVPYCPELELEQLTRTQGTLLTC